MKFNKTMVDIVNEIRHIQLSSEETTLVKLTEPDIGEILLKIYKQTDDVNTKVLITNFMHEAGEPWSGRLTSGEALPITRLI